MITVGLLLVFYFREGGQSYQKKGKRMKKEQKFTGTQPQVDSFFSLYPQTIIKNDKWDFLTVVVS